jgi:hypothetical protein
MVKQQFGSSASIVARSHAFNRAFINQEGMPVRPFRWRASGELARDF